jgi:hypothetical protein
MVQESEAAEVVKALEMAAVRTRRSALGKVHKVLRSRLKPDHHRCHYPQRTKERCAPYWWTSAQVDVVVILAESKTENAKQRVHQWQERVTKYLEQV